MTIISLIFKNKFLIKLSNELFTKEILSIKTNASPQPVMTLLICLILKLIHFAFGITFTLKLYLSSYWYTRCESEVCKLSNTTGNFLVGLRFRLDSLCTEPLYFSVTEQYSFTLTSSFLHSFW